MFFLEEFNNMQLELLKVYLLPMMCVAKEMLPPTKVRFFFSPLKGVPPFSCIIAAAQTENWGFCGQSKEKDEGKPNTYRLTVILVSLENKRCNLIEKP